MNPQVLHNLLGQVADAIQKIMDILADPPSHLAIVRLPDGQLQCSNCKNVAPLPGIIPGNVTMLPLKSK